MFKLLKNMKIKIKSKLNNKSNLKPLSYNTLMISPILLVSKIAKLEREQVNPLDWKDVTRGEYENKIRNFASIEKRFLVFANAIKYGDSKMTYFQFLNSLVPFQYIKSKKKEELEKVLMENKEFNRIMKKVDINGDGFINFEEFIILCIFLTLPLKEYMKNHPQGIITKEDLVEVLMAEVKSQLKLTDKVSVDARIVKTDYNTLYKLMVDFVSKGFTNEKININKDISDFKLELQVLYLYYEVLYIR